jgi:enolase
MNRQRRLPTVAEEALEVLREPIENAGDSLPKSEVKAVLVADDQFTDGEAEYALDVLQNRGYIYYVDECVRITPTD